MFFLFQVLGSSHCVMHDFCGENDFGDATCSYNGTAKLLDDGEALEILQEICPEIIRGMYMYHNCLIMNMWKNYLLKSILYNIFHKFIYQILDYV